MVLVPAHYSDDHKVCGQRHVVLLRRDQTRGQPDHDRAVVLSGATGVIPAVRAHQRSTPPRTTSGVAFTAMLIGTSPTIAYAAVNAKKPAFPKPPGKNTQTPSALIAQLARRHDSVRSLQPRRRVTIS